MSALSLSILCVWGSLSLYQHTNTHKDTIKKDDLPLRLLSTDEIYYFNYLAMALERNESSRGKKKKKIYKRDGELRLK